MSKLYEVVCPDGLVRYYPYATREQAAIAAADLATSCNEKKGQGVRACPLGPHAVREAMPIDPIESAAGFSVNRGLGQLDEEMRLTYGVAASSEAFMPPWPPDDTSGEGE